MEDGSIHHGFTFYTEGDTFGEVANELTNLGLKIKAATDTHAFLKLR